MEAEVKRDGAFSEIPLFVLDLLLLLVQLLGGVLPVAHVADPLVLDHPFQHVTAQALHSAFLWLVMAFPVIQSLPSILTDRAVRPGSGVIEDITLAGARPEAMRSQQLLNMSINQHLRSTSHRHSQPLSINGKIGAGFIHSYSDGYM
jgi:hypothetical protein